MLIGINEQYEIKQINSITDPSLKQIEIDREAIFGTMSDFMILHYKYVMKDNGYSISPAYDLTTLSLIDSVYRENEELKVISSQQDAIIMESDLKIINLETEKKKLTQICSQQDTLIMENDLRIMNLEALMNNVPKEEVKEETKEENTIDGGM